MLDSISRRGSWLDELTNNSDFRDPAEKLHLERKQKLANEVAQLKNGRVRNERHKRNR